MAPLIFSTPKAESKGTLDFEVNGTDLVGLEWTEKFSASRDVPPGVIFHLSELVAQDAGRAVYSITAIDHFMRDVLTGDGYERWTALINDRRRLVTIDSLVEVVQGVATELMGRPTGLPSASPG